jgi:hypothetical protein
MLDFLNDKSYAHESAFLNERLAESYAAAGEKIGR